MTSSESSGLAVTVRGLAMYRQNTLFVRGESMRDRAVLANVASIASSLPNERNSASELLGPVWVVFCGRAGLRGFTRGLTLGLLRRSGTARRLARLPRSGSNCLFRQAGWREVARHGSCDEPSSGAL